MFNRTLFNGRSNTGQLRVESRGSELVLITGKQVQSAWDPCQPFRLVQSYPALMLAAFAAWPGHCARKACRTLVIGLGAGIIQRHLFRFYPGVRQLTVEIDPMVHRIALRYFDLEESIPVAIRDGVEFIRMDTDLYDCILLDAFDSVYVPEHFIRRNFFLGVREKLRPGGLFLVNFWESSVRSAAESNIWLSVFNNGFDVRNPGRKHGNRILVGGPGVDGDLAAFRRRAVLTVQRLGIPDLDADRLLSRVFHLGAGG